MYAKLLWRDDESQEYVPGKHDPALFHRNDRRRLARMHARDVARAVREGEEAVWALGPALFNRIADARTMFQACEDLIDQGGRSAGPNRHVLHVIDRQARWTLCRALSRSIRNRTYLPTPGRRVHIPKDGKPGQFREIVVPNIEDRVVGRAVHLILSPILESAMSPFSYGFRPHVGTMNALADALALAESQNRWIWVTADVEAAFDRIPHARLLAACRQWFPEDVVELIKLISFTGHDRGIRQGAPDSPLWANLFFHQYLDQPWRRRHPTVPLLRYADDLLVPCATLSQAEATAKDLRRLASSAGTPVKSAAIVDLHADQSAEWLGYEVRCSDDRPNIRITGRLWESLSLALADAHDASDAPLRAPSIIRGWLAYMGPSFECEDRDRVLQRVRATAADFAFDEIPSNDTLLDSWSAAHARWHRTRAKQRVSLQTRLARVLSGCRMLPTEPGE